MSFVSWSELIQVGILITNSVMVLLNCIMVLIQLHNSSNDKKRK